MNSPSTSPAPGPNQAKAVVLRAVLDPPWQLMASETMRSHLPLLCPSIIPKHPRATAPEAVLGQELETQQGLPLGSRSPWHQSFRSHNCLRGACAILPAGPSAPAGPQQLQNKGPTTLSLSYYFNIVKS